MTFVKKIFQLIQLELPPQFKMMEYLANMRD